MNSVMNSRRAGAVSPLLVFLILFLGAVGTFGSLWWTGNIDVPGIDHLRDGETTTGGSHEGQVAVPIAAREIPAYTKVRRDDFWLPETQEFASVWLDKDVVAERGIMTAKEVLNRVLAMDKKKGYAFSEDDFLPVGTREGPAAGIEPGMRGLRVNAASIVGLHGLRRGDRFDLIATQNVEKSKKARGKNVSPLAEAAHQEDESWEVSTRIIVQNGKLVEPVRARQSLASSAGRDARVEEAFLGVSEEEITRLTEALALDAKILCVPRSALPGAGGTDLMAHARPDGPGVVEVYSNGKRSLTYVPRGRDYTDEYESDFYAEEEWVEEEVAVAEPEPASLEVEAESVEEVTVAEPEVAPEATLAEAELEPEMVLEVEPELAEPEAIATLVPAEVEEPVISEVAPIEAAFVPEEEPLVAEVAAPSLEGVNPIDDVFVEDCSEELELAALVPDPPAEAVALVETIPLPEQVAPITIVPDPSMTVMDAIVAQELGAEVALAERFLAFSGATPERPQADVQIARAEAVEMREPEAAAAESIPEVLLEDPLPVEAPEEEPALIDAAEEFVESGLAVAAPVVVNVVEESTPVSEAATPAVEAAQPASRTSEVSVADAIAQDSPAPAEPVTEVAPQVAPVPVASNSTPNPPVEAPVLTDSEATPTPQVEEKPADVPVPVETPPAPEAEPVPIPEVGEGKFEQPNSP